MDVLFVKTVLQHFFVFEYGILYSSPIVLLEIWNIWLFFYVELPMVAEGFNAYWRLVTDKTCMSGLIK